MFFGGFRLKIYNSATNKKEEFIPLHDGEVNIYSCGPTVYNYFHIGNARPFIVFDTLRRYFEYLGYKVKFVQNFTDVDDKMITNAAKEGITVKELGEKFIAEYFKDAKALNIKPATVHPKATEHIDDILALIQKLVDNGHAYVCDNGDVYFDTKSDPEYGKLSGQNLDDLELGARIEVNDIKKNPMDFALWKAKKDINEISWKSPWGEGRPGWHIECSAMSMKYLGETLDIHGGGQDLKFPHHENEIAQSECATGKPFVRYWMHNGYININNKKMSKSENNFFTVRDILKEFNPIAVRLFMLSAHYANPINFSHDLLMQAQSALSRIDNCRENLKFIINGNYSYNIDLSDLIDKTRADFRVAMDDDLNTADAIGIIFEYIKELNVVFAENKDSKSAESALKVLDELLDVLGLLKEDDEIPENIISMAEQRNEARKNKEYALADKLRDEISSLGYEIKDTPEGIKISKKQ